MSWQATAIRYAKKYGLDPNVFVAQMGQEAHGQDLTSPAGAQGPAQIMPATAKAWGVGNVHDINQAYDAAAKHMAAYVKQFGSYKDALVAYNAGPGAVGHGLPAETQGYIQTILHGKDPGGLSSPTGGGGTDSVGTPSVSSPTGANPFSVISSLSTPNQNPTLQRGWDMLGQIWAMKNQQAPTPDSSTIPSASNPTPDMSSGDARIRELFYDPLGGWDEGKSIGPIGGHSDHVHVAASDALMEQIVKRAMQRGMHVGQYAPEGDQISGHVNGSFHYPANHPGYVAADISGTPQQDSWLTRWVRRKYMR
jgi:hypothetical protein